MFDTPFDLDSYLDRIGFRGDRQPTLRTLEAIAFHHPASIPFENLDALLRRPVELDPISLQRKLVLQRRGGWCFEHNLLLGHALTALGFAVTGLAARVVWMAPPGPVRPRSHMLLRIELPSADSPERQSYLVDVGFGGLTLTGVLRFVPDIEQETPHERFRVRAGVVAARTPPHASDDVARRDPLHASSDPAMHGLSHATEVFAMEASVAGEWRPLYTFDTQPQARADYEVSNWYLLNHPTSHFLTTLVAARVDVDRRYALRNSELSVHHARSVSERRLLTSATEIRQMLDELFHIDVPTGTDVDAVFERLLPVAL